MKRVKLLAASLVIGAALLAYADFAFSEGSFFEGKTITLIQGRKPGGLGDMRSRAFIPFLTKHIPGHPTVVSEYMPGGGGRKLANHFSSSVDPDGLTIGTSDRDSSPMPCSANPGLCTTSTR